MGWKGKEAAGNRACGEQAHRKKDTKGK